MYFKVDDKVIYFKTLSGGLMYQKYEAVVTELQKRRPSMANVIRIKFTFNTKLVNRWVPITNVEKIKLAVSEPLEDTYK